MTDSIPKRSRNHFQVSVDGNEDRISSLPTNLIAHILSFLPTKKAVATSVLSTKWKYLWTSIITIDFDDELVFGPTHPWKRLKQKQSSVEMSFINFVYRVLKRNMSDLQKFRLRCVWSYDVSHVNAWVSTALSRNIRELHLSHISSLPCEMFTCSSLVVLKLDGTFVLNVPTLVCLQNLKVLVIDSLEFLDDDSIYKFFSSCPVLEDLSIKECNWRNISVFNISAPVLKSLSINCRTWYVGYDRNYKIVLNTPNLDYLEYKDYVAKGYSGNKLNALVKADISLVLSDRSMEEVAIIAEFVDRISKVQWLSLTARSMKTCELCRFPMPKFDHLTYLELFVHDCGGWELLLDFVENSPRLQTLIFGGVPRVDEEENQTISRLISRLNPPQNVPSCLMFHLKKFEIKEFEGESYELKMVEYFLKNSRVLEKLVICLCHWNEEWDIFKKLLMLPRSSMTCQVEVQKLP